MNLESPSSLGIWINCNLTTNLPVKLHKNVDLKCSLALSSSDLRQIARDVKKDKADSRVMINDKYILLLNA